MGAGTSGGCSFKGQEAKGGPASSGSLSSGLVSDGTCHDSAVGFQSGPCVAGRGGSVVGGVGGGKDDSLQMLDVLADAALRTRTSSAEVSDHN